MHFYLFYTVWALHTKSKLIKRKYVVFDYLLVCITVQYVYDKINQCMCSTQTYSMVPNVMPEPVTREERREKKNYVRNLAACEVTFQDITDSISNLIYILFTLAGKNA